jgi:hypothetical protein
MFYSTRLFDCFWTLLTTLYSILVQTPSMLVHDHIRYSIAHVSMVAKIIFFTKRN